MDIISIMKIAFKSLARNKTRTFLTMLGIIIGVGAVITMIAIGQGATKVVNDQISSMGTNVIMVMSNTSNTQSRARQAAGSGNLLDEGDVKAIQETIDGVLYVSPVYSTYGQLKYGSNNWRGSIAGADVDYFLIRDLSLEEGQYFYPSEVESGAKVCVIGKTVADNLFLGEDPVGKTMRIRHIPFTVKGVLKSKGASSMGMDQDDIVIAPYTTTVSRLIGQRWRFMTIMVSAVSKEKIPMVQEDIMNLLLTRHNGTTRDDFIVRSQTDIAEAANTVSKTLTVLLASIAGISLLVGGIGIMNIMLVSVTERIKEIGIRMAVGASKRDVLLQFIIEAITISLIGGLIGIIMGWSQAVVLGQTMNWSISVTPWSILLAVGFSCAVGIFFGWYPARKAANLNLIDALRYE